MVVELGLCDSLSELEHLKAEGLNSDNLIGVDVDLLLVAFLVCERSLHVESMNGVLVVLRHDGAIVACFLFGDCLDGKGGLSGDIGIGAKVKGLGGGCESRKTKNEFH